MKKSKPIRGLFSQGDNQRRLINEIKATVNAMGGGTFIVSYPSGHQLNISGTFNLMRNPEHGLVPTIDTGKEIVILDPRGVVAHTSTSEVVYFPHMLPLNQHARWCRQWLKDNPRWGTG